MLKTYNSKLQKYEESARQCSIMYLSDTQHYQEALQLISSGDSEKSPEILISAANCLMGLKKYHKALELLCHAEQKGWLLPDIISTKGRILFWLGEYEQAKSTFESYENIYSRNKNTSLWLLRCAAHITLEQDPSEARIINIDTQPETSDVRSDWYQSNTTVTLTLFVSQLSQEQIDVQFHEKFVEVKIKMPDLNYRHTFNLYKEIVPEESKFEITPSKVEIKMKKVSQASWKAWEINV